MSLSRSIKSSDEIMSDKQVEQRIQNQSKLGQQRKKIKKTSNYNFAKKDQMNITHFFHQIQKKEQESHLIKNINTLEHEANNKEIQELQAILQELNQKQLELERLYEQEKAMLDQSKEKLHWFKKKSKNIVSQALKDIYAQKRQEKRRINVNYGYNKLNSKTFINGPRISQINQKVKRIESQIASGNLKPYEISFLERQLHQLRQQSLTITNSLASYQETIKLANQQKNCELAREKWPLYEKRYQVLELLGKGGFSQVYKCYDLIQNKFMALKLSTINRVVSNSTMKEQYLKHIQRETETHRQLEHRNIAKLLTTFQLDSETIAIIMEYCSGPQLSNYMKICKSIEQKQAKSIIYSILDALAYLNRRNTKIIHYDLKPQNIIFHNGVIKLLDFGLCKLMQNEDSLIALTSQGVGTYWYLPPETFQDNSPKISNKVDIWSVGVIFYELMYRKRPFGHNMSQRKILKDGIILNAFNVQFPQNQNISKQCEDFIAGCLNYDPNARFDPEQAFNHKYFDDIRSDGK